MIIAAGTKKLIEGLPEKLRPLAELIVMMVGMNYHKMYDLSLPRMMIQRFCDMLPDGGRAFSNDKLKGYWDELNSTYEHDFQLNDAVQKDITTILMYLLRATLIVD